MGLAILPACVGFGGVLDAFVSLDYEDRRFWDARSRADEVVRISKHAGKNRVTGWPRTPEARKAADENRNRPSR
jgi:hypothetical protein